MSGYFQQSQSIRQSQVQRISPAMMMEFSLLQLPVSELKETIKKEIESNPALEIEREFAPGSMSCRKTASSTDHDMYLESLADEHGETLDAHLLGEMRMSGVEGRDLELAKAIVESLDKDGRFTSSFADLIMILKSAGVDRVTESELEAARQRVMATDPRGCAARDVAECYRAQIAVFPARQRQSAEKAIEIFANALAKGGAKALNPSDLKALEILKKLDPYPSRLYDRVRPTIVVPDVIVDAKGNVSVDQGDIPDLRVSAKYVEMAKDRELDDETRTYAAERVKRAREFREALIKRKETIEQIAEVAVSRQLDFLSKGSSGLKRLTMTDVAREAKCTIATVSRAAARKYVKTPKGTVPLRKFFVLVDQKPVEKLRELLQAIPVGTHVSDMALSEQMAKEGFVMARRTVAKYRHRLGF